MSYIYIERYEIESHTQFAAYCFNYFTLRHGAPLWDGSGDDRRCGVTRAPTYSIHCWIISNVCERQQQHDSRAQKKKRMSRERNEQKKKQNTILFTYHR